MLRLGAKEDFSLLMTDNRRMPSKTRTFTLMAALLAFVCAAPISLTNAQQRDISTEPARPTRDWVRDGVIYEIYPRAFSAEGNFKGVTARLDDLKQLVFAVVLAKIKVFRVIRESSGVAEQLANRHLVPTTAARL